MAEAAWKRGFKRAMINALIQNGVPIDPPETRGDTYYGYISHTWRERSKHIQTTGVDYEQSAWAEAEWNEFKGTFYEGDTREVGIDLMVVLTDGSKEYIRWSGSAGDLILSVVNG